MTERKVIPAKLLVGRVLNGHWTVQSLVGSSPGGTGGSFSVSYIATDSQGQTVFIKAIDFSAALNADDFPRTIQQMTEAYNYERDLLRRCGDRRLNRIVRVLDDGKVEDQAWPIPVHFLVFEHAEKGDVRTIVSSMEQLDMAFVFRSLHHVSVGLQQLHSIDVVHQDLKPSNVVVFDAVGSKLADLGRSSTKEREAQWDRLVTAGDRSYCPPEQMYGYAAASWDRRRRATDLYHLGSMLLFMFTGVSATQALIAKLEANHLPFSWNGTHEDVMPYLVEAFDRVLADLGAVAPPEVASEVCKLMRYLSHPDLNLRGHPADRAASGSNYQLKRFVSAFNRLAYRAEHGLFAQAA